LIDIAGSSNPVTRDAWNDARNAAFELDGQWKPRCFSAVRNVAIGPNAKCRDVQLESVIGEDTVAKVVLAR
jgi:hypothetical protein